MSFDFKMRVKGDEAQIDFVGDIDEQADFGQIGKIGARSLVINLRGIRLMNSVGLRSWIHWVKTLTDVSIVQLQNCPVSAVNQMGVLEGFLPMRSVVTSFEVPYLCESCNHATSIWANRGEHFMEATADADGWNKIPSQIDCSNCKKKADLDAIPARYFRFMFMTKK